MSVSTSAAYRPRSAVEGASLWTSGHTADVDWAYFGDAAAAGGPGEQTRVALTRIGEELAAHDLSFSDITCLTENVPTSALAAYGEIEQARNDVLGGLAVPIRTRVVTRLLKPGSAIEIEVNASSGGVVEGKDLSRWHRSAIADTDEIVTLPTLLPVDEEGRIVAAGDVVGQYAYILDRAAELLNGMGLSLRNVVRTLDFMVPSALDFYPHQLRRDLLGPVYPCAFAIFNDMTQVPGALVALDITVSRLEAEAVNPGWSRYDDLSYSPAVRVGRRVLIGGTASIDNVRAWPMFYDDPVAQCSMIFDTFAEILEHAGGSIADLVKVNEYLVPEIAHRYPEISAARRAKTPGVEPATTAYIVGRMGWPVFHYEAAASAVLKG
jgi:enamine deaminase RidA (YjgF/YER057c/UK114 family)